MNHADHVRLIQAGIVPGVWAELGSGTGAFTLALAEVLGPEAEIHSVDRDAAALREQAAQVRARFPRIRLHQYQADFTAPLALPPLTGLLMANALHFVRAKAPVLARVRAWLKPAGRLVVVEYNVDHGNPWVPHPFSFETWQTLARAAGFETTTLLARQPSRFLNEFYAALSV